MIRKEIDLYLANQVIEVTQDTELYVTYIGEKDTSLKGKLTILHKLPNIKSRVSIKAVVFDNAKFDLEGILQINKGATGTDTYLKIDCLVVGESAFARAIPSLEIKESEVKGGHGATIGYIDQAQLNYLYSKGLDKQTSENLIIEAFVTPAIKL